MKTTPNYFTATNKAYELLSNINSFGIPIPIFDLFWRYRDIKLLSYTQAAHSHKMTFDDFCAIAPSNHGYSIKKPESNKVLILFNDKQDDSIIRFTLAHELGHCVLNHNSANDIEDKEANCFARNILCPIPVVKELKILSAEDYSNIFGVSVPMGKVAMLFRDHDQYYITKQNYSNILERTTYFFTGYSHADLYRNIAG